MFVVFCPVAGQPPVDGMLVRYGCQTDTTDWPQQQKFMFPRFWRTEVQDQGAGRVGFLRSISRWLAGGRRLAASSYGRLSLGPSLLFLEGHWSDWIGTHPTGLI